MELVQAGQELQFQRLRDSPDRAGYDAQILRSIIDYCHHCPDAWPELIQFETMGHCDKEGWSTEWHVIKQLQGEGYILVNYSGHNSHLVLGIALEREQRLKDGVNAWRCSTCKRTWELPSSTIQQGCYCRRCQGDVSGSWQ